MRCAGDPHQGETSKHIYSGLAIPLTEVTLIWKPAYFIVPNLYMYGNFIVTTLKHYATVPNQLSRAWLEHTVVNCKRYVETCFVLATDIFYQALLVGKEHLIY